MMIRGVRKTRSATVTGTPVVKSEKSKSGKTLYFSPDTQRAIEAYQANEDRKAKERIYVVGIMPAFDKLVENLIFMYGFAKSHDSYETLKCDCISFLYEQLYKFDASRGTKAFSYFNVVARNWLIIKTKQKQKSDRRHISIDDENLSVSYKTMIENSQIVPSQDDIMMMKTKKDDILNLLKAIKSRLINVNEIMCLDAIIELFTRIDDLEFLNKRALFVYIRDLSNLSPKQVSTAMSAIRRHYKELSQTEEFRLF